MQWASRLVMDFKCLPGKLYVSELYSKQTTNSYCNDTVTTVSKSKTSRNVGDYVDDEGK